MLFYAPRNIIATSQMPPGVTVKREKIQGGGLFLFIFKLLYIVINK